MQFRVRLGPDLARAAGVPVAVVEAPMETTVEQILLRLGEDYPAAGGPVNGVAGCRRACVRPPGSSSGGG